MKSKQELIDQIAKLPEGTIFTDDDCQTILWRFAERPRLDTEISILVNNKELAFKKNPVMGFEIVEAAEVAQIVGDYPKALIEELPNGTSRMISKMSVIVLRNHMKFTIIRI